jgi:hypothetical protein
VTQPTTTITWGSAPNPFSGRSWAPPSLFQPGPSIFSRQSGIQGGSATPDVSGGSTPSLPTIACIPAEEDFAMDAVSVAEAVTEDMSVGEETEDAGGATEHPPASN